MLCKTVAKRGIKAPLNPNNQFKAHKEMVEGTNFSADELQKLYKRFNSIANNDGHIDFKKLEALNQESPISTLMDRINTRILKSIKKQNDKISFSDYAQYMDLLIYGDIEGKCKLSFYMIADGGRDNFTKDELRSFVEEVARFSHTAVWTQNPESINIVTDRLFDKFDYLRTGVVSFEEFRRVFMVNENVFDIINNVNNDMLQEIQGQASGYPDTYLLKSKLLFIENLLKNLNDYVKEVPKDKKQKSGTFGFVNLSLDEPKSSVFASTIQNKTSKVTFDDQKTVKISMNPPAINEVTRYVPYKLTPKNLDKPYKKLPPMKLQLNRMIQSAIDYNQSANRVITTPNIIDPFTFIEKQLSKTILYLRELIDDLERKNSVSVTLDKNTNLMSSDIFRSSHFNIPKTQIANVESTVFLLNKNWNLVLNMMLGIQQSIHSLSKYYNDIKPYDFIYKTKIDLTQMRSYFSAEDGSKVKPSFKRCFFTDYASYAFRSIRRRFNINDTKYVNSIGSDSMIMNLIKGRLKTFLEQTSSGKSGSFFYFSSDGQYVLKTIKKSEKTFLRSILDNYYKHLMTNPDSLITKIYGLHKIAFTRIRSSNKIDKSIYFIIMSNTFNTPFTIHTRYDLKGSLYKREVRGNNPSIAKKDINFLEDNVKIQLSDENKGFLMKILRKDCEFFKENNIIDYSMLLGIHSFDSFELKELNLDNLVRKPNNCQLLSKDGKNIYFLAIIDFLTDFNFKKRSEYTFCRMLFGPTISAIPTKDYAERFYDFITASIE